MTHNYTLREKTRESDGTWKGAAFVGCDRPPLVGSVKCLLLRERGGGSENE